MELKKIESPYINTKLGTTILLKPHQMDNKLYLNLKKNLEAKLLRKCYKHYGYITDIYEILKYNDGVIEAENLMASATYDIEFSCNLCKPLKNQTIVCQIDHVSKVLITASNGPIYIIITNDRVNDQYFFTDTNNNLRYRKDEGSKVLEPKEFIKVTIISVVFNHGDEKIKGMGFLENVASEDEIKTHFKFIHKKKSTDFIDFSTYEENEKKHDESDQ